MGFKFCWLVELLEDLDRNQCLKATNAARSVHPHHRIVVAWFNRHDAKIRRDEDGVALLSAMFPGRRPDRVYNMQEKRIASIFGRALCLASTRLAELRAWQSRPNPDFSVCLESVMAQAENPRPLPGQEVTLEEISIALDQLAANSVASSPELRSKANGKNAFDILEPILLKMKSNEAKWLVRMLLKSFHPVQIPENVALQQFHFLLPDLLAMQNNLGAAVTTLNCAELRQLPRRVSKEDAKILKSRLVCHLVPKAGVMIARPAYLKARSIKHCCRIAGQKRMSVEQKYDGEYCQIHIDLSKGRDCIEIFSKSGKNSTNDRIRLHGAIQQSLQLGTKRCKIKNTCILEGELLVWNRIGGSIQPFHKIRKHVQHGGRFLDMDADSPVGLEENLMIMYYDVLLLDEEFYLNRPQEERRRLLERLITKVNGLSDLAVREVIDFRSHKAASQLRGTFARCITQRLEGLVLKGCDAAYFSWNSENHCIKLKKDYIVDMGDVADLAIIGARLDPKIQRDLGLGHLIWNSFYLGCLENKDEVIASNSNPVFRVVGEVSFIPTHDMEYLNARGQLCKIPFSHSHEEMIVKIDQAQMVRPDVLFEIPFIVEILGSGFDKAPTAAFYTLRHPRLHKLHTDRSVSDTLGFNEMQNMAQEAMTASLSADSQEDKEWIRKLKRADPRSKDIMGKCQSTTPGRSPDTATTVTTSPDMSARISPSFRIWNDSAEGEASTKSPSPQKQTSHSPKPPGICNATSGSKRKLSDAESLWRRTPSRTGDVRSHASERTNLRPKQPSPSSTKPVSNNGIQHQVMSATKNGLKQTPPWCRSTGFDSSNSAIPCVSPAALTVCEAECSSPRNPLKGQARGSRAIVHVDGPLSEVANLASSRKRQPARIHQDVVSVAAPRTTSSVAGPHPNIVQMDASLNSKVTEMRYKACMALAPLPTPPATWEAETLGKHQACVADPLDVVKLSAMPVGSSRSDPIIVDEVSQIQVRSPPQADARKTTTSRASIAGIATEMTVSKPSLASMPPVLLTSCLRRLAGEDSRRMTTLLWNAKISFTYSAAHFLHHIGSSCMLVSLVDLTAAQAVADIMLQLLTELQRRKLDCDSSGGILFLDWKVLGLLAHTEDLVSGLGQSRQHFAGGLRWARTGSGQTAGTKSKLSARAFWDWREVIDMVDVVNKREGLVFGN